MKKKNVISLKKTLKEGKKYETIEEVRLAKANKLKRKEKAERKRINGIIRSSKNRSTIEDVDLKWLKEFKKVCLDS